MPPIPGIPIPGIPIPPKAAKGLGADVEPETGIPDAPDVAEVEVVGLDSEVPVVVVVVGAEVVVVVGAS